MTAPPEVTVIIPTKALAVRATRIHRALNSMRCQQGVRTLALVVVNGSEADPALVDELKAASGVRVLEARDKGIPHALRAGREAVTTEWFTALDDDDEILPGGLAARIQALEASPECSTVITNSVRRSGDEEHLEITDMSEVERSPLRALAERNWLRPGAWLCRSAGIPASLFDDMPKALECTYLAIRFVLNGGVCFLDQPTIAHYTDTPDSETKSKDYAMSVANALPQIRELPLPADTRRWIDRRISSAHHGLADAELRDGRLGQAWRWHLRSLGGRRGWRYLPFTRHLLLASVSRTRR